MINFKKEDVEKLHQSNSTTSEIAQALSIQNNMTITEKMVKDLFTAAGLGRRPKIKTSWFRIIEVPSNVELPIVEPETVKF